jgi:hypothetical protein
VQLGVEQVSEHCCPGAQVSEHVERLQFTLHVGPVHIAVHTPAGVSAHEQLAAPLQLQAALEVQAKRTSKFSAHPRPASVTTTAPTHQCFAAKAPPPTPKR